MTTLLEHWELLDTLAQRAKADVERLQRDLDRADELVDISQQAGRRIAEDFERVARFHARISELLEPLADDYVEAGWTDEVLREALVSIHRETSKVDPFVPPVELLPDEAEA